MKYCRIPIVAAIAVIETLLPYHVPAATPTTSLLQRMAQLVRLDTTKVSGYLVDDCTHWMYEGRALRVRTNIHGELSHIGYQLFSDDVIAAYPDSRIFDFVERYLLELQLKSDERVPSIAKRMALDGVIMTEGNTEWLQQVTPLTSLSIDYVPRRMYRFSWSFDTDKRATLEFKADCQLIIGATTIELEQVFSHELPLFLRPSKGEAMQPWKMAKQSETNNIRTVDAGYYLSPGIESKLVLERKGDQWEPIMSADSPVRSLLNLLLTGGAFLEKDVPLLLEVDRYGYHIDTLHISLGQLYSFMLQDKCKPYIGVKRINDNLLEGTLFFYNESLGYNHLASFICPMSLTNGGYASVKMHFYAYIPLQNVSDNFFISYKNLEEYE